MPFLPGLKRQRVLSQLTQDELAARTHISRATISKIERLKAQARISTMRKLVQALGCDVRALLADADTSKS